MARGVYFGFGDFSKKSERTKNIQNDNLSNFVCFIFAIQESSSNKKKGKERKTLVHIMCICAGMKRNGIFRLLACLPYYIM